MLRLLELILPIPRFNHQWSARQRGAWGERVVARHLWRQGFRLLEQDWKDSAGSDIDLIAANDDLLLFCEVKLRTQGDAGPWSEVYDEARRKRLAAAAAEYLRLSDQIYVQIRFDAFLVQPSPEGRATLEQVNGYMEASSVPGWRGPVA